MDPRVGLCSACRHHRAIRSDRGSEFHRCGLAGSDPRFVRYPPIPVVACEGFEAEGGTSPGAPPRPTRG